MPKLTNTQYFIIILASLGIMAGFAYLNQVYIQLLVGLLYGIVLAATHVIGGQSGAANVVQGVNLGVPLQTTPTLATATLGQQVEAAG